MGVVLNEVYAYQSRLDVIYLSNKGPWSCSHGEVVEHGYSNGEVWVVINLNSSMFDSDHDMVLVMNSHSIPFMGEVLRKMSGKVRIGLRLKEDDR